MGGGRFVPNKTPKKGAGGDPQRMSLGEKRTKQFSRFLGGEGRKGRVERRPGKICESILLKGETRLPRLQREKTEGSTQNRVGGLAV